MRRPIVFVLLVALALSVTPLAPVHADKERRRDGNDARGPLDIARISHGHRTTSDGRDLLVHSIRLHEAWPVKKLRHRGFANVYFELRGHPGNPPERTLQIEYSKGRLVAHMYDSLGDPPRLVRRVRVRRPDWRSVRVVFPKSLLRKGLERYKWNVVTFVEGGHELCSRRGGCTDWAPDLSRRLRYVRHVL